MMTDVYDEIANAEARKQGIYPVPGIYPVVQIETVKLIKNNNRHDCFVAELRLLESAVPSRPTGSQMSYVCNLTKHQSAASNVKRFIAAAMNVDVDEVDADSVRAATSDENPLQERVMRLEAHNTKTRAGGDFTVCNWIGIADDKQIPF